jgi:predicted AlkP superfamily pyrophosphatase or phosphodiesterase
MSPFQPIAVQAPLPQTLLMEAERAPLVLVNAVGLTAGLLPHAPRMQAIAQRGWVRRLREVLPAVTCTAQATILTGRRPEEHGVVANGWLFRDTGEVRFWQQSNRLIQAEPLYVTARRRAAERGQRFTCAKLFWWFNQGAEVDWSVTPKPHYGADGNKVFGISGTPPGVPEGLELQLGPFPFARFWGPMAGRGCTEWIARAAAQVLQQHRPSLTLVYLPHLDYDPQRFGPGGCNMRKLVGELDADFGVLADAAEKIGARVWIVSEYSHCDVQRPVYLNRVLRNAGLLLVRDGPFGEMLETFESRAFAVCDHQLAHVYVKHPVDVARAAELIAATPGVAAAHVGDARSEIGLRHPRSGEIVVLAERDAWFAYPYWLEDKHAPDFARTVDIHRKPGFDPCELRFDPWHLWPKGRVLRRLVQKKLGFRTLFDVIPLDELMVGGSHGLAAGHAIERPVLIGDAPPPREDLAMEDVHDVLLAALVE